MRTSPVTRIASFVRATSIAAAGLLALTTPAAHAIQVNWAGSAVHLSSGAPAPEAAGAPNATVLPAPDDLRFSTFTTETACAGFDAFLGIDAATLARTDFIAWDENGGDFYSDVRWESARFIFRDGTNTLTVDYVTASGPGSASDPAFIGDGALLSTTYLPYFGAVGPPQYWYAFVLFDLPPAFNLNTLTVDIILGSRAGLPGGPDNTPDIDAAGTLPREPTSATGSTWSNLKSLFR